MQLYVEVFINNPVYPLRYYYRGCLKFWHDVIIFVYVHSYKCVETKSRFKLSYIRVACTIRLNYENLVKQSKTFNSYLKSDRIGIVVGLISLTQPSFGILGIDLNEGGMVCAIEN